MTQKDVLAMAEKKAVIYSMDNDPISIKMLKLKDDIEHLNGFVYRHTMAYKCDESVAEACAMVLARVLSMAKGLEA